MTFPRDDASYNDDCQDVACQLHLVMQGKQSGGNFADEIEPGTVANT